MEVTFVRVTFWGLGDCLAPEVGALDHIKVNCGVWTKVKLCYR